MNMITYFNELVTKNFNNYLKNYFNTINYINKSGNFINYYNFMQDLDSFNDSFIKDIIKGYFEYVDECFFNSSYRRNFCESNGFYPRKNFVLFIIVILILQMKNLKLKKITNILIV